MEARKCFISAIENLPAFTETIQFIFDRCNGRMSDISKKRLIRQIESSYQMLKEYFKSSDFVKARNHNHLL